MRTAKTPILLATAACMLSGAALGEIYCGESFFVGDTPDIRLESAQCKAVPGTSLDEYAKETERAVRRRASDAQFEARMPGPDLLVITSRLANGPKSLRQICTTTQKACADFMAALKMATDKTRAKATPEPPTTPQGARKEAKAQTLQKPKCKNVTFSGPLLAAGNPMGLAMNSAILNDPEAFVNHKRHQPLQCTPRFCFGAGLAEGKGIARFEDTEKGITVISGVLIDDAGRMHESEVAIKSTFVRCKAPAYP